MTPQEVSLPAYALRLRRSRPAETWFCSKRALIPQEALAQVLGQFLAIIAIHRSLWRSARSLEPAAQARPETGSPDWLGPPPSVRNTP